MNGQHMKNINIFIQSGIIESYVLGLASIEEIIEVEAMSSKHTEVYDAINNFCNLLEANALANAVKPPSTVKTMVMATIDLMERMQSGEALDSFNSLSISTKIVDFEKWLSRPDMIAPTNFDEMYAKIIGYTPQMTTAVVWIKTMAPQEIHTDEYERFLIIEGTCNITIGNDVNHLTAGDYLAIPLFKNHQVVVTSKIPCKAILQREAA